MTPADLLSMLHDAGVDAGADFNDGLDQCGWFGWRIDGDVLTVHYESAADKSQDKRVQWRIIPRVPVAGEPGA